MKKISGIITLTSDFGSRLGYVAQMKGVILALNPQARLVDIDHGIPPHDIVCAALTLEQSAPYFSRGSIHLAVIDPGVGGSRRAVIAETESAYFVGPDNGLFGFLNNSAELRALYEIDTARIAPEGTSFTFHGRDIFAPAAARLSLGEKAQSFAWLCSDGPLSLHASENREVSGGIDGRILCADNFGNLLTSITQGELDGLKSRRGCNCVRLRFRDFEIPLLKTYSDLPAASLLAYVGSGGRIEIALNCASALKKFGDAAGEKVRLEPA